MAKRKIREIGGIGDLMPDAENPRRHTSRNVGMIVDALHEVGAARSIVIDEGGNVLAGNATVEAAAEAGITKVKVVDADGEELVAVRRTGLTGEQKKRLAYFDNRATDLSGWDADRIAADLAAGLDLSGLFLDVEIEALLAVPPPGREAAASQLPDTVGFAFGVIKAQLPQRLYVRFADAVEALGTVEAALGAGCGEGGSDGP